MIKIRSVLQANNVSDDQPSRLGRIQVQVLQDHYLIE